MRFEHIIQINDLTKPEIPQLTRSQIWEGLVLRARRPDKFLVGVDEYEILDKTSRYMKRWVQLPGLSLIDEVWFTPEYKVEYRTQPTASIPGASLTMQIEEPEPDSIFVRFIYAAASIENRGDSMPYDKFLQEAYVSTDVETIQIIRELVAAGAFID